MNTNLKQWQKCIGYSAVGVVYHQFIPEKFDHWYLYPNIEVEIKIKKKNRFEKILRLVTF